MSVSVYDDTGRQYYIGDQFFDVYTDRPLVTEKRHKFSFPFGDAEMVQIGFSGIYIVYGDMAMYESRKLYFEIVNEHDLVEMHFTLSGVGEMQNRVNGAVYTFQEGHHNLHYTPEFSGVCQYRKDTPYKFFELHFTNKYFYELARESSPMLMQFASKVAENEMAELSRENLPMSFAMHQCISEIMNCRFTGGLKLMFLQSKCIELLALQAQMYEDNSSKANTGTVRSDYDKERIHFAREYLLQHSIHPPTLTELARISGINEFKLKRGFKELFNNTVFGYLNDHRLNHARELLLNGNSAIKEVADDLGYSSVPHFSNAFRKKFGIPPGKVKRMR